MMSEERLQAEKISATSPDSVRQQLAILIKDEVFRGSKRSIKFLCYVVEQTLDGQSDAIKERTIGIEVFGRNPSYETASDHVVRTAANELRKRLFVYYGDAKHSSELRITLTPGSYIPRFSVPSALNEVQTGNSPQAPIMPATTLNEQPPDFALVETSISAPPFPAGRFLLLLVFSMGILLGAGFAFSYWRTTHSPEYLFWRPLLESPGTVLLAVGDIPSGPPSLRDKEAGPDVPVIQRGPETNVPFADTITIARILSVLQSHGKRVIIRPEMTSSFADFKEGPAVLIGAFNNEWSLRLTHHLRYSLALDSDRHLIYIRDAQKPDDRSWSQVTGETIEKQQQLRGGPVQQDYALISRVKNPETGQVVVIVGGLYEYGTQAAGEFITAPSTMRTIAKELSRIDTGSDIQLVLRTPITDDTPGVPKVISLITK